MYGGGTDTIDQSRITAVDLGLNIGPSTNLDQLRIHADSVEVDDDFLVEGNFAADGEIGDFPILLQFSYDAAFSGTSALNLKWGEVQADLTTMGWSAIDTGSVVAISYAFEVTAHTGGADSIAIRCYVAGSNVFAAAPSITGTGFIDSVARQARDVDAFSTGDIIGVEVAGLASTTTIDDIIVSVLVVIKDW